jgi:PAS domain S-box-containing protein
MKARFGVRTWLAIIVLVVIAPGAVLLVRAAGRTRAELAADVRDDVERSALIARDRIGSAIEIAHGSLSAFGDFWLAHRLDRDACSALARMMLVREPGYLNIGIASADGAVACSAFAAEAAAPDRNLADRLYFRRAIAGRDVVVGQYVFGRLTGRPTLHVAHPILDAEGQPRGVAFAALDLAHLERQLAEVPRRRGEVFTVVDGTGTIVARHPEGAGAVGTAYADPVVREMLERGRGFAEAAGSDGVPRMYAFVPAGGGSRPKLDLVISAAVPRDEALIPVDRYFARTLATYALVAVVMLLVATVLADRLVAARLQRLAIAAARVHSGESGACSGVGGPDEIGAVGRAFDAMSTELDRLTRQNRLLLESAGVGIFGVDVAGRVTFANPASTAIIGLPAADVLGRPLRELLVPAADGSDLLAPPHDGVRRHEAIVLRRADGGTFPADVLSTPIREDGVVAGAVVALRDVSDRVQLEEQLRHSQKMEAVGRLAGGVAHDFNNVLTVILSAGEYLASNLPPENPLRAEADEIVLAGRRAASLTRQLLTFSRKQVVVPVLLDPNEAVRETRKLLLRIVGEDVELVLDVAARGHVRLDRGQLEQILLNLAVNARDAMPGGGKLTIRTSDARLEPGDGRLGAPPGDYVRISVSDEGTGMDAATLSRLFEPFFTTKDAGKGTGLGLSTVWGILKQSRGDVRVRSAPGEGSTFDVYLPSYPPPSAPAAADPDCAADLRGSGSVLLVEDDAEVRAAAARMLRSAGYDVHEAARPDEALGLARRERIDLLLTDVVMPEMSGPDLAQRVLEHAPRAALLFMSGYTGGVLALQQVVEERASFIQKPFTSLLLLSKVREILYRSSNQ